MRVGEARVIPGRVDESVHRVGLAPRSLAALRAGDMLPRGVPVERIARLVEGDVLGELHRQVCGRDRHDAAGLAMDDGDRAAPVTLPRDAPIAELIIDLALALRRAEERRRLEAARDLLLGLR